MTGDDVRRNQHRRRYRLAGKCKCGNQQCALLSGR
jgi:hypothetical protein